MSQQILRAPTTFLAALASTAYNSTLQLFYATGPVNQQPPTSNLPIATGAAAGAFINAGSQILTGMPAQPGPAPTVPNRSWRLVIFPSQAIAAGLHLERPIELNEECALQAGDPTDLLALGFTPYAPVSGAPLPLV